MQRRVLDWQLLIIIYNEQQRNKFHIPLLNKYLLSIHNENLLRLLKHDGTLTLTSYLLSQNKKWTAFLHDLLNLSTILGWEMEVGKHIKV